MCLTQFGQKVDRMSFRKKERKRERKRERNKQTNKQINKQTNKQTKTHFKIAHSAQNMFNLSLRFFLKALISDVIANTLVI